MCDKCNRSHVPDLGACPTFRDGKNGRCVYCDHASYCHPGGNDQFNTPLPVQGISAAEAAMIALSKSLDMAGSRVGGHGLYKQL